MPKKIIIFTLLATLLIVISGCQVDEQPATTQKTTQTKETAQPAEQNQTASLEIMEDGTTPPATNGTPTGETAESADTTLAGDPTDTPDPTPALTEADLAAYQGALQLLDETFCDKISIETAKLECKTQITDQKTLSAALTAVDATQCEQMSTDDKKEACRTQVEIQEKKQAENNKFEEEKPKNEILLTDIISSNNYERCNELTLDSYIRDCELSILVKKAVNENDNSWCDKASVSNQATCLENVNLALELINTQQ